MLYIAVKSKIMRKNISLIKIIALTLFVAIFASCKKEAEPQLEIISINEISNSEALVLAKVEYESSNEIIEKGFVWSKQSGVNMENRLGSSTFGGGSGEFSHRIVNLEESTVYYVKAYLISNDIAIYSKELSFKTLETPSNIIPCPGCETIEDIDGNIYRTTYVAQLCWLVENLKTTKYNDGSEIDNVTANQEWKSTTSGAYCAYDNDEENVENYGMLYNYYAVESGKLCPTGWHVATDEEWKQLESFVDSEFGPHTDVWDDEGWRGSDAAVKLKSESGWLGSGGTNDYGFTALPGGQRDEIAAMYQRKGEWGLWWSANEIEATNKYRRHISNHETKIARFPSHKNSGFSVKCVKD